MSNTSETTTAAPAKSIECRSSMDPFIRMLVVGIVMIGWGLWSGHDAFMKKDVFGNPVYSLDNKAAHFIFNVAMLCLLPPGGVVALVWALRVRRRVLVADEEGLGYIGKQKIGWNRIKRLVPRGKGLLDVYYEDARGTQRRLKLDSWLLKQFNELVAFIEAKAPNVPVGREK